ncbi:DNA adenine methylase, partial [Escherichia coli]|uniref:DNA adenine methylase n=1 Tax=Escherichia coli TaxID=562 RepID=UPI002076E60B
GKTSIFSHPVYLFLREFSLQDFRGGSQYHLASILEHRSSEGHPVIVSNNDTSLIRSLYRNFTHHYIKAKRSIGVSAGEGKSATEIIAVSGPSCWLGFDPSRGVDSSAVYGVCV